MPAAQIEIQLDLEGDRLGRFTADEVRERFVALLGAAMAEVALPAWRDVTPVRTGRLRRSTYAGRADASTVVIGVNDDGWYWFLQEGLPEAWADIVSNTLQQVVPPIIQAVTREALEGATLEDLIASGMPTPTPPPLPAQPARRRALRY